MMNVLCSGILNFRRYGDVGVTVTFSYNPEKMCFEFICGKCAGGASEDTRRQLSLING